MLISIAELLPPLPPWNAAHPLVVHLPLGVTLAAPVLLVHAIFARKSSRLAWSMSSLCVLILAAVGGVLAAWSGEAGEHATFVPAAASRVLHEHEELGELSRNLLIGLAAAHGVLVLVCWRMGEKCSRAIWVGTHGLVLVGVLCALLALANTGHLGGRVVHEFGVRAPLVVVPPVGAGESNRGPMGAPPTTEPPARR